MENEETEAGAASGVDAATEGPAEAPADGLQLPAEDFAEQLQQHGAGEASDAAAHVPQPSTGTADVGGAPPPLELDAAQTPGTGAVVEAIAAEDAGSTFSGGDSNAHNQLAAVASSSSSSGSDAIGDPAEAVASPVVTAARSAPRPPPADAGSGTSPTARAQEEQPAAADVAVKTVAAPAGVLPQTADALASAFASGRAAAYEWVVCSALWQTVVGAVVQFVAASYAHQLARSVAFGVTAVVVLALPSPAQLLDKAVCGITAHPYLAWVRPASCSRLQWDSLPAALLEESLDMLKAHHSGCWGGAAGAPAVPQAYVWKAQLDACEAARAMVSVQLQHERVELMTTLAQQAHDSGVTARVAAAQRGRDHTQADYDRLLEEQAACASKCWFGWRCSYTEHEKRTCPSVASRAKSAAALLHLAEEELEAAQAHRKFYNLEDFEKAALANLEAATTDTLLGIAAGPVGAQQAAAARLGLLAAPASADAAVSQPSAGGSSGDNDTGVAARRAPMAIIAAALAKARTYDVAQLYSAAASDPEALQFHVAAALENVQAGLVATADDDPATSLAVTVARVTQVRTVHDHVSDNCKQLEHSLRSVKLEAAGQALARFKHAVDALAATHPEQQRGALKAWADALHHRYLPVPRQPSLHLLQCLESTAGACRPMNAAAVTVRVARVLTCSYGVAEALEALQAVSYRFLAAFITFLAVSLVLQPSLSAAETWLLALNPAWWARRGAGVVAQVRVNAQVVGTDGRDPQAG